MHSAVEIIPPFDGAPSQTCAPRHGSDADSMRRHLLTAFHALEAGAVPLEERLALVRYLEQKALADAPTWFQPDEGLAWACREYFSVADRLMDQLERDRSTCPRSNMAARQLASTSAALIHRVLAYSPQLDAHDVLAAPVLATACGASARFRQWCSPDEPGHDRMMIVMVYSLVGLVTRAACGLLSIKPRDGEPELDDAWKVVDEALNVTESLLEQHPQESSWFDLAPGRGQQGSRIVRAMRGIAGSCEVLAGLGEKRSFGSLRRTVDQIERMWPAVFERPTELAAAIMALAHVVQAQAVAREEQFVDHNRLSYRAAWLARQAASRKSAEPLVARALLELCATMACADGMAVSEGEGDSRLRELAAELTITTIEGGGLRPEDTFSALGNLSNLAAAVAERGCDDAASLMSACGRALTAF